jgi:hypothetical protein
MKGFFSLFLLLLLTALPAAAEPDKVAVVVYGQDEVASRYQRVAQTRFEQILLDNGVVVLDQDKAEELKDTWGRLSDPGALITAEDFVENAGKYEISGIYRIYLSAGHAAGLAATFTATASADIRFVDADARLKAAASAPMGTKGMPPSDGLTEAAALNNAIQRAVDHSAVTIGLAVMDTTNPRLVRLALEQVDALPEGVAAVPATSPLPTDSVWVGHARLQKDDWTSEEPTCVRVSPDGHMGVVGTYLVRTAFNFGRPTRSYASYLHVVDAEARNEVERFEVSLKDPRYQRGGSRITDCLFLRSWRYVAAVSQSHLIFADTERGVELGRHYFSDPFERATLTHLHGKSGDYLVVTEGGRRVLFQIVREGR